MENMTRRPSASLLHIHTAVATLGKEVERIKDDQSLLRSSVVELEEKLDAGFNSLSAQLSSRSATPWTLIISLLGLILAGMTTVGWLAREPLVEGQVNIRGIVTSNEATRVFEDRHFRTRLNELSDKLNFLEGTLDEHRRSNGGH